MENSEKVNIILNCFVDMNLETNENFKYDINVLDVSFSTSTNVAEEGSDIQLHIDISEPSISGIEEAEVVLANITTTSSDIDLQFPIRLKWNVGEQRKTITIPINSDFLEEGDESFSLGITSLTNLKAGRIMSSIVSLIDRTELKVIGIIAANTNVPMSPRYDPNARIFNEESTILNHLARADQALHVSVTEGDQISISVGLDSPSQYGVEKVDVTISGILLDDGRNITTLATINTSRLEWMVGEQFKTLTINTVGNSNFDGTRNLLVELARPENAKFDVIAKNRVLISVKDPPISRRFTTLNLNNVYKQRGSVLGNDAQHTESELSLRAISNNQNTNTNTLYWLVEMGTSYTDVNNTPELSESANYDLWPDYYFGINQSGYTDDIILKVTNQGIGDVEFNGSTYGVGQSMYVTLAKDATTIVLPSNDGFLPQGSFLPLENTVLDHDTFMESKYKIEIQIRQPIIPINGSDGMSGPHGFQLKSNINSTDTHLIGDYVLPNHASVVVSTSNALGLFSEYSSIRTRFNGAQCTGNFAGQNKVYNVRVKGIILLSSNSLNTGYISHEFRPENDFIPICGPSAGIEDGLHWISIPFEII